MAASRRLPRGTRRDPIALGYQIERDSKQVLDAVAVRAGVSSAVLVERMIAQMQSQLTEQGIPAWWPDEVPVDDKLELPISA